MNECMFVQYSLIWLRKFNKTCMYVPYSTNVNMYPAVEACSVWTRTDEGKTWKQPERGERSL